MGQAELPFDLPPGLSRRQRIRSWARARAVLARDTARDHPRQAASAVAQFLGRWLLRVLLPLAGVGMMLHLYPYHATAGGVHFRVEGTVVARPGLAIDTTFGNWEFGHVDGLPIGAHVSPEDVDVVPLAASATRGGQTYIDALRADFVRQMPKIAVWLIGEAFIGMLFGLAAAVSINLALRHLRHRPYRPREVQRRSAQFGAAMAVVLALTLYGSVSYNRNWAKESRLTGTLAALQLFPGQLEQYYAQQANALTVVSGIASIQAELQQTIEQAQTPDTAYNIMFISDMHLATTYPLVRQYAANFAVKLIVNTGDESIFGTTTEMTSSYLSQIRELTKTVPMIWLAGNHDSPDTVRIMAAIPGVTVLGGKSVQPDGTYSVTALQVDADGLSIAGVGDPRVYGSAGPYGADAGNVTDPLERRAVDDAVVDIPPSARFDIFATHEPVGARQLVHDLPGQIRQTNAGHTHRQNADADVQGSGQPITLVEGTTGAGGLKRVGYPADPEPIAFSIESVAPDCQFTKLVRFQIEPTTAETGIATQSVGQNVTATTLYLTAQQIQAGRACSNASGVGDVRGAG